ncbi:YheC/YheD family protein [Paenibacillus chibensis]|uniref:YheC/YheD family protein n=1 Tax=Paenibacillus chibensis TaxID=59846 RepID=UPI001FE7926C|nr:YheC/YheD family protein [Paenibacillus chibensis]MEC0371290.1 YheC/YheD family protein [Paenibacillus chibensis]
MKKETYKMGKLGKYEYMKKYTLIRAFLPDTRKATLPNINIMLRLYKSVFLKPDEGTGGHGIYKITRSKNSFILRTGSNSRTFSSLNDLYTKVQRNLVRDKYIVQEGIDLLKHNDRPFDIRVMVQKNRKGSLDVTGIIGRQAKRNKIVTNYHSGGTPLPVDTLLKSHLNEESRKKYIQAIEKLGKDASIVLGKNYRSKRAFGVDIAVDHKMNPWILEINTKPDMSIFNTLKNKTMYNRIRRYSENKG